MALTPHAATLAWDASTDNSGRFTYQICCANVSSEKGISQNVTTHAYSAGLEPGRSFTLRMYAVDAAGNFSKPSNTVTFTLPPDRTPPGKPTVSVTQVGTTHVALSWSGTDDGPHLWFTLFVDGLARLNGTRERAGTIFLLDAQSTHSFAVQARDFGGNRSPLSDPLVVTTNPVNPNDVSPPTQPMNLHESHFDDAEIHLTWDQSVDDFDPQWLIRYDVHVNGVLSDIAVGRGRSIVYGDNPGVNTITVTAVDTAGNRSAPTTIIVTF